MKNKIIENIINSIKSNYDYSEVKLSEIRYGLEALYLTIIKLIIITLISLFFKTTSCLYLFILTYGILRLFAFGLHTKNSVECLLLSTGVFTIIPLIIKYLSINTLLLYIIDFILLLLIIIYAPSDTEKRPLINSKKRIIYKILSIVVTILYIGICIYIKSLFVKKLLSFSILLEVLLILPISYKIFGLKYNNYLRYKRKEE